LGRFAIPLEHDPDPRSEDFSCDAPRVSLDRTRDYNHPNARPLNFRQSGSKQSEKAQRNRARVKLRRVPGELLRRVLMRPGGAPHDRRTHQRAALERRDAFQLQAQATTWSRPRRLPRLSPRRGRAKRFAAGSTSLRTG
jgi:hypothetical protein